MHGPGVLKAVSLLLLLACVRATGQAMLLQPGQRVIVVGDVHGDIDALRDVLSMANVTDKSDEWVAQDDVLVQLGDLVDRGGFSDQCVDFMLGLQEKARKHGGEVVLLMGNHELLNLQGSNEYTAPEEVHRLGGDLQRSLLFSTRGNYGKRIVDNFQTMYINGASAFVHAGLNQEDAALGSHLLNEKVRKFLRNNTFEDELFADNGPFWTRQFVRSAQKGKCDYVTGVLSALSRAENRKIKHVFIGHTIQPRQEVHRYCGGRVIATDVGMSYGVGRGLLRRAVTVITRDEISTIHKGSAGDDGTSLMSQGAIVFPFIATIITPVVAVASAVAMIRATRNLRNRLDVSLRSLCHALSPW